MNRPTPRGVVFDWDGTLADTHGRLYAANAAVMRAFGLPFDEQRYRRAYRPDWRRMYEEMGVPPARLEEASAIWERAFGRGEPAALFPGVRSALERLHDVGVALALVTAGPRPIVDPELTRLGLAGLIRVRIYGDEIPAQKPDPASLLLALEGLAIPASPAAVAYLGDAPDDMRMARRAGVRAVGVDSGMSAPDTLRTAGADEVVGSVAEWVEEVLTCPSRAAS